MAKLLRPNEKISFLQTRAPAGVWRPIKAAGITGSSDGTATRLCTVKMLEFLALRPWISAPWLRPQDLERGSGTTGFIQVNLPLSNQDEEGKHIPSAPYLKARGLDDLFDADKVAYKDALESGEFVKLVRLAAQQLEVSGATFGYTFLHWLRMRPEVVAAAALHDSVASGSEGGVPSATAFTRPVAVKTSRARKAAASKA